jgi:hypothetical protein
MRRENFSLNQIFVELLMAAYSTCGSCNFSREVAEVDQFACIALKSFV